MACYILHLFLLQQRTRLGLPETRIKHRIRTIGVPCINVSLGHPPGPVVVLTVLTIKLFRIYAFVWLARCGKGRQKELRELNIRVRHCLERVPSYCQSISVGL